MIASSFARCIKSVPQAASRPSLFRSRVVSHLPLPLNNRGLFELRPLASLPLSEREIIYRLEKSLLRTQLLGIFCLSVTTCTIALLSAEVQSLKTSVEDLNQGFESAGRTLVEGFHGLNT